MDLDEQDNLEIIFEIENFSKTDLTICSEEELQKFAELFSIKSDNSTNNTSTNNSTDNTSTDNISTEKLRSILISVQLGGDVPEEYQKHKLLNKIINKCFTYRTVPCIRLCVDLTIIVIFCIIITIAIFVTSYMVTNIN